MKRCFNCMNTYAEEYEVCPHCGYVHSAQPKEAFHLYPGTVLHKRYVVGATVGIGGFGITYRAWDQALDKQVAVKEYFPNGVVNRVPGNPEVIVFSEEATGEFQKGRVRFLAEAENMARFNAHPNIVDVYDFFEENHTAYIVMEFLDGLSFKQYLSLYDGVIPWQKAVEIVNPVLKALKEIHKKKIVHRDISPDNIYILPLDSQLEHFVVKVIDFGAARLSDGEEEKTLSIILKPGFAPPEQYEKNGISADVIVVDPPRKGCDKACLDTIVKMAPERVVYISCDSATLARDVKYLGERGYQVKRVRGIDQFGHCVHTETVIMLSKIGIF